MNHKPLIIGLTGGIGSGKTTVAKIFATLEIPIYNSDLRARHIMEFDVPVMNEIKKIFGKEIYLANNKLDRKTLANIVFKDVNKLKLLNNIVHPAVFKDFDLWTEENINSPYLIKESALLIETLTEQKVDKIIVVTSPLELRLQRLIERDGISKVEIMERMNKQMADEKRLSYADFIIYNDEKHGLINQVINIHFQIINSQTQH